MASRYNTQLTWPGLPGSYNGLNDQLTETMGSWAAGLYSGDFALDLRSVIRAVVRLPFDADRLVALIEKTETAAASSPDNEDHTTFWLVLADQFARRGVASARVNDMALRILESGQDLDMQRKLGSSAAGLRKRRQMLAELRQRILSPANHRGPTLRHPQPFLMSIGDALIYPTCGGKPRNPYAARVDQLKIYGPKGGEPWSMDSWAAIVIVERGRAFDFLTWYRPLVIRTLFEHKPDLRALEDADWRVDLAGTCSRLHFQRMGLERVGGFEVEEGGLVQVLPGLLSGDPQAIQDISIANRMSVERHWSPGRRPPFDRVIKIRDLAPQ